MNLSWQNIELDLLFDAGYDGRELVKTTQDARSIRATEPRQAGLRLLDDMGDVVAALGAEFLPDQSGQLLVLVVSSGEMDLPESRGPQPGLSRDLAWEVLGGAVGDRHIAELGAGVLRFDRALMTEYVSEGDFRWLAASVVRMLAADAESLPEEQIAGVLGLEYVPRAAPPEPSEEPIPLPSAAPSVGEPEDEVGEAFEERIDEPEEDTLSDPYWFVQADEEAEPEVEAVEAEDYGWEEADPEIFSPALDEMVEVSEAEAEPFEEPEPEMPFDEAVPGVDVEMVYEPEDEPLDEAQADLLRLLMQDVELPPEPEEPEPVLPAPVDEADTGGVPSKDEIARLVEALRDITPTEADPEDDEEVYDLFDGLMTEPAAPPEPDPLEDPAVEETDWMVDYEAILTGDDEQPGEDEEAAPDVAASAPEFEKTGEPVAREDDVWWGELELWDEKPATAGPLPLRDLSRQTEPPVEEAPVEEPAPRSPSSLDTRPLSPPAEQDTRPAPRVTLPGTPEPEASQEPPYGLPELPVDEEAERYEYPPRARERSLTGTRTEYYLCAACGRYSAEKVGGNSYRCRHCSAVIEYRLEPPRSTVEEDGPEP